MSEKSMRRARIRRRAGRFVVMVSVALFALGVIAPAIASGATTDRIEGPFDTVVPTAYADNLIGVELMFAECDFVKRVELPDGSAKETQSCELTDPVPDFPGTPPDQTFRIREGACSWASDYWGMTDGSLVLADTFSLTVTPSGQVLVTTTYPADPIAPEDCGF